MSRTSKKLSLSPLEIYKVLPQTNCSRCFLPTCFAFATSVVLGKIRLTECPFLDEKTILDFSSRLEVIEKNEPDQAEFIDKLEKKISQFNQSDLAEKAKRIGATYTNSLLTINSFGKDFHVDNQGKVQSECHIISWVVAPILSYITHKTHSDITGKWISFREFNGGMEWQNLFVHRCEDRLCKLADDNPNLLEDIIELFMGEPIDIFDADISFILYPLPHIPILICYQRAEEDLESKLDFFFDECCATNLHVKSIFTLCAGIVQMFKKIAEHHL